MQIFVGACGDPRVVELFPDHEIKTAFELGWHQRKDHLLLPRVQGHFDVFVTIRRRLRVRTQPQPAFLWHGGCPRSQESARVLSRLDAGVASRGRDGQAGGGHSRWCGRQKAVTLLDQSWKEQMKPQMDADKRR